MKNRIVSFAVLAMLVLWVGSISLGQSQSLRLRERHSMQKTIQELQRLAVENVGSRRHSLTSSAEWALVNPWPTDVALIRVRCEDNYALALAAPGPTLQSTLLQTTDAGESWVSKLLDRSTVALDVAREGNNLWIAGGVVVSDEIINGFVGFSPDGGTNWTTLLVVDSCFFGSLCRFDDQNLIAAGVKLVGLNQQASVFYHTTNGGQTWTAKMNRFITDFDPYYGVCFTSHNRGSLLQYNSSQRTGSILATIDGGQTWAVQYADSGHFNTVSFVDSVHGWLLTYKYTYPNIALQILATTNGGTTWSVQRTLLNADGYELFALDQSHVWFAALPLPPQARDLMIYRTTNGGAAWVQSGTILSSDPTFYSNGMHFSNPSIGWIVGSKGIMFRTTNSGTTWQPRSRSVTYLDLTGVDFTDSQHGWICGYRLGGYPVFDGQLLRTQNGGGTWTTIFRDSTVMLYDVEFVNDQVGIMLGNSMGAPPIRNKICRTANGGNTWSFSSSDSTFFSDVTFSGDQKGWIGGFNMFRSRPVILHTTNAGIHWAPQSIPDSSGNMVNSIFAIDQYNLWAVGSGTLLKTTNGGTAWQTSYGNLPNTFWANVTLMSVYFHDPNNGWLTGYTQGREFVFKTTNGGSRWDTVGVGRSSYTKIYFADRQNGWLLGRTSYRSTDGGQMWLPVSSPREVLAACFIEPTRAWAVGEEGRIFKYAESITDVEWRETVPARFRLEQNYPNPFNPFTIIRYQLPIHNYVTLKVYDVLGREVATLVNGVEAPGYKSVTFDARLRSANFGGQASGLASGVYFYRLEAGGSTSVKKMVAIK